MPKRRCCWTNGIRFAGGSGLERAGSAKRQAQSARRKACGACRLALGAYCFAPRAMNSSFDLIIVGAGIVGAACAAECARVGFKVLVVDRGPIGGGTTAAGMGHIVVMDDSEAQFALGAYSRRLWIEQRPQLPRAVEYDDCGTLWVAADAEEM